MAWACYLQIIRAFKVGLICYARNLLRLIWVQFIENGYFLFDGYRVVVAVWQIIPIVTIGNKKIDRNGRVGNRGLTRMGLN